MPPRRAWPLIVAFALCVHTVAFDATQLPPYGGAREYVADLRARRAAVMSALGPDAVLVLWSAPRRVYSTDTDYEYRQESNLLYLTGLEDEPTVLVLVPGASGPREFLFVRTRDPFAELWSGPIPAPEDVAVRTGVSQVFAQAGTEAFDAFFEGLLGQGRDEDREPARLAGRTAAPAAGAMRLLLLQDPSRPADDPAETRQVEWARRMAAVRPGITLGSGAEVLTRQRRVKTQYEQRIMRRAVEIAAEAHIEGMKATRPGRWEYEVEAAIEHWFLKNGAMSWGYPSIVGSGPNATVLHYTKSTRQMQAGELLLVDAGANFQGLTGDISRTWPVSGTFSPDQRLLYEIVLAALDAGVNAAKPGGSVADVNRAVRTTLGRGLLRVGLVTDPGAAGGDSRQIDLWFPHGPVHGIGTDVHESLGALVPGVTFVVEPGIYVRADALDRLSGTPDQASLVRALRPAVDRFSGIGIRIEESLLMTSSGPEVLSSKVPTGVSAIERLVGAAP